MKPCLAFLVALALGGCGGGGGGVGQIPADSGSMGPDLAMLDCSDPCKCAERGPPDFSKETLGAIPVGADADQQEALLRSNHWRTAAGLPPFDGAALLQKAATAHATYLSSNARDICWQDPHTETQGCTGFTGGSVGERETAAGYHWLRASEVVNWEDTSDGAIDRWLWSVYHRLPFMDYRINEEGYASVAFNNVMDLATALKKSPKPPAILPVFPLPGDHDVPTDFRGDLEEPTPPSPGGGGGQWPPGVASGQVVSLHFSSTSWKVSEHHIYMNAGGACSEVPHTMATKDNDATLAEFQSDDVFLYADDVLTPGTEYVVVIAGQFQNQPYSRSWAFTTAD